MYKSYFEQCIKHAEFLVGRKGNYLKNDLSFQTSDKNMLIQTVKSTVESLIIDGNIPKNPIIEKIFNLPHTQKNLNVNFGAHMIQNLTEEIIVEFIQKKEDKKYRCHDNISKHFECCNIEVGISFRSFIGYRKKESFLSK